MLGQKREKREIVINFNRIFARNWQFLVVLILGVFLSVGVWSMMTQVLVGENYALQVAQLQSASKGWANGQLVPQVDPSALGGFGYAYNLFGGPLLSYVVAGLQALVGYWPVAINLVLILCLVGSGLTMCYAMTKISKNQVLATLIAVFYMAMPYVLDSLYARVALGELAALVAAPVLLLGLYQLTAGEKHAARSIALAVVLLVLAQSSLAVMFGLMAAVYVVLNLPKIVNWQNIWRVVLGSLVAFGLTAFFILPWFEAGAGVENVAAQVANESQVWPQQLLAVNGSMALGIVAMAGVIGFWFVRRQIEDENQRRFVTALYMIAALAIVLALPVVDWNQVLGGWQVVQFPGQWLIVTTVSLAVVAGYTLYGLVRGLVDEKQCVAMVVMSVIAVYLVMPMAWPQEGKYVAWEDVPAAQMVEDFADGALLERGEDVRVLTGDVMLQQASKNGLNMNLTLINSVAEDAVVELPMIYYPGYQATMEEMNLQVNPSHEYGLVAVTVPAGAEGEIKVQYGLSLATQIGGLVSAITAGLGVIWVLVSGVIDRNKRKKQAEVSRLMDSVREVVEDDILTAGFNREADKEAILASLGEPEAPAMPTVAPPDLPIPQPVVMAEPAVAPVAETEDLPVVEKPKRTRAPRVAKTKTTSTRGAKSASTTKTKTAKAAKTTTKKAAPKTTKTSSKSSAARRTTTTRVRTVKSNELED